MDLRFFNSHEWLRGSPWQCSPREVEEQTVMRKFVRSGDTVFDIGANIGLHTVLLSKLVGPSGKLFVFEPNAELLKPLRDTVSKLRNAALHPFALSDTNGISNLFVVEDDHSLASLSNWTSNSPADLAIHTVGCEMRRMDDLVANASLPRPDFIKCDVEGAELKVFTGGRDTLNVENAPVILFEANVHTAKGFGVPVSAARDFLEALPAPRYRFFILAEDGKMHRITELDPVHSNPLAVPAAKLHLWPELPA